jgi:hypothetical protein
LQCRQARRNTPLDPSQQLVTKLAVQVTPRDTFADPFKRTWHRCDEFGDPD